MEMREIAWNSITEKSRKTVIHPMEQAAVELFGIEDDTNYYWAKSFSNTDANKFVAVTFKTDIDGRVGPIVVYIDPINNKIIGHRPRW